MQICGHCVSAPIAKFQVSSVPFGVPAGAHTTTGTFVQVNGGSTNTPLCAVAIAGPNADQLMFCGNGVLLHTRANTVMHVPGLMATSHGVAQVILHLPA